MASRRPIICNDRRHVVDRHSWPGIRHRKQEQSAEPPQPVANKVATPDRGGGEVAGHGRFFIGIVHITHATPPRAGAAGRAHRGVQRDPPTVVAAF